MKYFVCILLSRESICCIFLGLWSFISVHNLRRLLRRPGVRTLLNKMVLPERLIYFWYSLWGLISQERISFIGTVPICGWNEQVAILDVRGISTLQNSCAVLLNSCLFVFISKTQKRQYIHVRMPCPRRTPTNRWSFRSCFFFHSITPLILFSSKPCVFP